MRAFTFPLATLCAALTLACTTLAQPSGGPYGPQEQNYAIPAQATHVIYAAPNGKTEAAGTTVEAPTTIENAFAKAVAGDVIVLRGGTYRTGGLVTNQGITVQPYGAEKPVLKGTRVATEWEPLKEGIWRTKWDRLFPMKPESWWRRHREGMYTPVHKFNNDMVFIDGRPLQSVGWEGELTPDTFFIDYDAGHVFIRTDPKGKQIEITAHDSAIIRTTKDINGRPSDKRGYTLRGLTLTQYAYRALEIEGHDPEAVEDESKFGKDAVGTVLEHCSITHCSRVGGYFRGDGLVIRHCLVSDTSTEGIFILGSSDCLLEKNIFRRNNVEHITGYYPSAVKIFNQTHRVVVRDNLVTDNHKSNGIWYDVGNRDGVFLNNWIEESIDGFFYEISHDVLCAGNVFVNCEKGIRILNAAGARMYNNTLINSVVSIERTERNYVADHFGWHMATSPALDQRDRHVFVGNLMVADENYRGPLYRTEQTKPIMDQLTKQQLTQSDYNTYVRAPREVSVPLIQWAPFTKGEPVSDVESLDQLRAKLPQYEAHSALLPASPSGVFRSVELRRLEPIIPLAASPLPAEVATALGWPVKAMYTPGAYQN